MRRRDALASVAAAAAAAVAGCTSDGTGGTDSPTDTDRSTGSPTRTPAGATLDYFVYSEDDRTHPLEVRIEDGDGTVVHRRTDPEFEPGERLSGTLAGLDPGRGPYPITVALESVATTVHWEPDECPRFDLLVAVTQDGPLEVQREECIK